MLLKLKDYNQPLAMGLIWAVATNDEINDFKKLENLQYGFINPTKAGKKSRYRLVTFTNQDDNNAVSFAGLLAAKYDNLIYLHRLNEHLYWLCIIKDHEVWNDIETNNGRTAGDLLCDRDTAFEMINSAKADLFASDQAADEICRCSELAHQTFPSLHPISFADLLAGTKTYQKNNKILLLDKYQLRVKRIVTILCVLGLVIGVLFYAYSRENAAARERARLQAIAAEQARRAEAKIQFTYDLRTRMQTQQGAIAIARTLATIRPIKTLEKGWRVTQLIYDLAKPHQLDVHLSRENYGDLLSFNDAYKTLTIDQHVNADNNSGTKRLQLKVRLPQAAPNSLLSVANINHILKKKYPIERYRLISNSQRLGFKLKLDAEQKNQFGYNYANFTLQGQGLWNLSKFQHLLAKYPTSFIEHISMTVEHFNISWTLKGELYG